MGLHRGRFMSLVLAAVLVGGGLVACDDEEDAEQEETEAEEDSETAEADGELQVEDLPFYATGPIARIDDHEISEDDFNEMVKERVEQLPGQLPPQMVDMFKEQIFDFAIDKYLVDKKLEGQDIEVTDEDIDDAFAEFTERFGGEEALEQQLARRGVTAEEIREDMYQDVQLEKYLSEIYDLEVAEEDLREFFEMHKDRLATEEERHARHVLLEVEQDAAEDEEADALERATAVYEEAADGADFEELAREHSEGPTASRGGDLGFFPRHQMVPEFSDVAFEMEPGDISEPVRSQFGFHVIQLVDIQEGGEANFEDARSDIELQLTHQKRQEVFQEFLEELKEEVQIERMEDNITVNTEALQQAQPQGMPGMPQHQQQGAGGAPQPQQRPQQRPQQGGGGELELERPELELDLGEN